MVVLLAATKNNRKIIGLTGKNASGKGVAAQAFIDSGYTYVSLSDALRKEAEKRGMSHSREDLIQLGQDLRKKEGPGVLAAKTIAAFTPDTSYVVDSIRHPAEIEFLKNAGNFTLIGVDAPVQIRYERAMKRGRDESAITLDDFIAMEERENSSDKLGQQLNECLALVDILFQNDKTVDDLTLRIRARIAQDLHLLAS